MDDIRLKSSSNSSEGGLTMLDSSGDDGQSAILSGSTLEQPTREFVDLSVPSFNNHNTNGEAHF